MKPKQYIKYYFSTILTSCGLYTCYDFIKKKKHIILTFHKVHQSMERITSFDTCPSISEDVFAQIISHIKAKFKIVSLKYLCNNLSSSLPLAALTFDDGWRDNYQNAFPILLANNLPATIFVVTGKIGSAIPFWQQELGAFFQDFDSLNDEISEQYVRNVLGVDGSLKNLALTYIELVAKWKHLNNNERQRLLLQLPISSTKDKNIRCFLNESEIHEMSQNNIEFGSHTHDHSILPTENLEVVITELKKSKKIIGKIIGEEISVLAYPNGGISGEVIEETKNAGYKIACTTINSRVGIGQNLFELPRIDAMWDDLCFKNGKLHKSIFNWVVK